MNTRSDLISIYILELTTIYKSALARRARRSLRLIGCASYKNAIHVLPEIACELPQVAWASKRGAAENPFCEPQYVGLSPSNFAEEIALLSANCTKFSAPSHNSRIRLRWYADVAITLSRLQFFAPLWILIFAETHDSSQCMRASFSRLNRRRWINRFNYRRRGSGITTRKCSIGHIEYRICPNQHLYLNVCRAEESFYRPSFSSLQEARQPLVPP